MRRSRDVVTPAHASLAAALQRWHRIARKYILIYMKRILIELDDACARDLERVAPARERKRAEFVRLAIRRAIDLSLDRGTERAYRAQPVAGDVIPDDLVGWDEQNALAKPASSRKKPSRKRRAA